MMNSGCSKVYLITGCSSELGLNLAYSALKSGARVIATSCDPSKSLATVSKFEALGGKWLPMDITSPDLECQVSMAHGVYGRIDCLLNGAGCGITGAVETISLSTARSVFETNFWGTVRITQLILPNMRTQRSGCIVNISSPSIHELYPGYSFYAASKAALEAVMTCLAGEVAGFGIGVICVIPSDMRTEFLIHAKRDVQMLPLGEVYISSPITNINETLLAMDRKQNSDLARVASRIIEGCTKTLKLGRTGFIRLPIAQGVA